MHVLSIVRFSFLPQHAAAELQQYDTYHLKYVMCCHHSFNACVFAATAKTHSEAPALLSCIFDWIIPPFVLNTLLHNKFNILKEYESLSSSNGPGVILFCDFVNVFVQVTLKQQQHQLSLFANKKIFSAVITFLILCYIFCSVSLSNY